MQHDTSDLGDLKIDLGAPNAQGYGGMAEPNVPVSLQSFLSILPFLNISSLILL